MNFKKMLSICKRSKAYFLYDLPDGEQMLSNGSCGYILYGHPEYTPETLRMVADLAEDDSVVVTRVPKAGLPLADQCPDEEYAAPLDTCIVAAGAVWQPLIVGAGMTFINKRSLQPIEKEEEGYYLYKRGDLVVVKSGLIVQGVISTMDLSKAEAVCRDLINLGTVAAASIKTALDFDSEMSRVKWIAGATDDEIETLRKKAIQLSAGTVLSASEYLAGMAAEFMHGKTLLECLNTDLGTVAGMAFEERNNGE